MIMRYFKSNLSEVGVTLFYVSYIIVCFNMAFFKEIFHFYQNNLIHFIYFWFLLTVFFICLISFLFLSVSNKWIFKPLLSIVLIASAAINYFQQKYNILFDYDIFQSVIETNFKESKGYLNFSLYLNLFLTSIPIFILWSLQIQSETTFNYLKNKIRSMFLLLILAVLCAIPIYKDASWMFREHTILLDQLIPVNLIRNGVAYAINSYKDNSEVSLKKLDHQATRIISKKDQHPTLLVLVVGETVRAANWGLNNYKRNTTPLLAKRDVINFTNVTSCGTLTAISLPCMFSANGSRQYNKELIQSSESLLHLLFQTGVSVLWRDNQSGCKGVCKNLNFEDMGGLVKCRTGNCRDVVLLEKLEEKISKNKDTIIVLHMNGNHGPDYYNRYPKSYEYWRPACHTSNFSKCTTQEIINSYDNATLYTDNILSKLIDRLKKVTTHKVGMIYISDHGESLGEYNLYLHGLPFLLAPDYQKKIPMVVWLSKELYQSINISESCMKTKQNKSINHDYLFSSILRIFEVKSKVYQEKYDLFNKCEYTKI